MVDPRDLLPASWWPLAEPGPVRAFNPGLLGDAAGWMFAYRVVGPDLLRRIGICRLGRDLRVIEGSPLPLSDRIRFAPGHRYSERATSPWSGASWCRTRC